MRQYGQPLLAALGIPPLELLDEEDELLEDEDELLDDELLDELLEDDELLDEELLLEDAPEDDELDELELDELELLEDELELLVEPQLSTTPPPPHWLLQVLAPIQLWLFSQPQPLSWLTHSGRISPYQLHTWHAPPDELELLDELDELEFELEELELDELELELELEELELELEAVPPP